MRYVIGCSVKTKDGTEFKNGLWVRNALFEFILPFSGDNGMIERRVITDVFEYPEWAILKCQQLARKYRYNRDTLVTSSYIRNFYPLKVDSLNFPFRISIVPETVCYMTGNRFGEPTGKETGEYLIAHVDEYRPKV